MGWQWLLPSFDTDSFLRNRSSTDHEATAMMKAQFMSLWDGLDTDYNCQVSPQGAGTRGGIPSAGILCLELLGTRDRVRGAGIARGVFTWQ